MVPKRTLVIAVVGMAFLLVAGLALAAFLSSKQTASSSFSAAAFGEVSIGDAEGTALFDLTDIQLGDSASTCFAATVTDGTTGGDWRIYSGGVNGDGLEDYLWVLVRVDTVATDGTPAGIIDCSEMGSFTPLAQGTLADYAAANSTYLDGANLGAQTPGVENSVIVMVTVSLADTAEAAAASGLTASTSWVIENQT